MSTTDTGKTTDPAAAGQPVDGGADGDLGEAGSQLSTAPVETAMPGSFGGPAHPVPSDGSPGPFARSSAGPAGSGGS
ncbi:hypothetical protein SAV14893_042820 [Streptomyces avermitilis]|uniref:Uncharacterized protein n=1 Tax=Streptomyces avermitilis TaxID=33903 RepID=A0A4D4M160_STRAX|nr:hypothetical protein SAV14893_042820 [Streptomyces avermitilis]GDY74920.1 hypothetical protein SAV31267_044050 [Streptomyces avermitilis]